MVTIIQWCDYVHSGLPGPRDGKWQLRIQDGQTEVAGDTVKKQLIAGVSEAEMIIKASRQKGLKEWRF